MAKSKCICSICVPEKTPKLRFFYGQNRNKEWYWHIKARNGEIVASGEDYKRVKGCIEVYTLFYENASKMPLKLKSRVITSIG